MTLLQELRSLLIYFWRRRRRDKPLRSVLHTTPDGRKILLREPTPEDAESVVAFLKQVVTEADFLITLPEEVPSVEAEENFIERFRSSPNALMLMALDMSTDKVVGMMTFSGSTRKKLKHTGEFGISVLKDYQGKGIATALINSLFEWAKSRDIKKIHLQVMANNLKAISLYKKLGFEFEGMKRRAIRQTNGSYEDLIMMGRWLDEVQR